MADLWHLAGVLHLPGRLPFEGTVVIAGSRIVAVREGVRESDANLKDLRPHNIVPGFIDLHVHGGGGWNLQDPSPEMAPAFARFLASQGTTAFQASLGAAPVEYLDAAVATLGKAVKAPRQGGALQGGSSQSGTLQGGARLLGIHMEGPFLNPAKKGAMPAEFIIAPDPAVMEHWLELSQGTILQVTIAPERPGALALIESLAARGITMSGGHTDATYEETEAGIDAGITIGNHTYNAMRGLDHRAPGALGAYLEDPRITSELICDGLHVHPGALRLALEAKGLDQVCVISDAVQTSKLPPGKLELFGRTVIVREDGTCRLPDGTLAGSTFHQVNGVKLLVEKLGLPLADAAKLASENPARVAGVGNRKGRLAAGYDADIVVLDEDCRVRLTVVEGDVVYQGEGLEGLLNPKLQPERSNRP